MEGVEGPMGNVPQVVARKGGMPAPRTRLQHLVDSEVLEKKRWSDTTNLLSSRVQEQAEPHPRAGRHVMSSSGARRRQVVFEISFLPRPAVTNNRSQCGRCAAVRSR